MEIVEKIPNNQTSLKEEEQSCKYYDIDIDTQNGSLFTHKNNEILPFVTTWMNLDNGMLIEICQKKTNTI